MKKIILTLLLSVSFNVIADGKSVNFLTAVPAESELMFKSAITRAGGINKFDHSRKPATVETQRIVRSQSDMLYSHGVFDASNSLSVSMPERMTGYHSVHLFDANHGQLGVVYAGETLEVSPDDISTTDKHIYAMMRTSTDKGVEVANQAQDQVKIVVNSGTPYNGPGYDEVQLVQTKRVLAGVAGIVKAKTAYSYELEPDTVMLKDGMDIDKYNYVFASLLGWGLMPNNDAYYPQLVLKENDCTVVNFPKPPVQYDKGGYWSFTAYGLDGYLHNNNSVISNYLAKPNSDGSYTVNVGNGEKCKTLANNVDMPKGGASISLRLYRPTNLENAKEFETIFRSKNMDM